MSEKNSNLGKTVIFSTFLFGSLLLIISLWVFDIVNDEPVAPNYVRATLAIPSSEGVQSTLEALPTTEEQHGKNGGQGLHTGTPAPSPTFNVDDWKPDEDLSSDLLDE